ncbi:MAG: histidine kinase [Nannocystaceae bacterium]
MGDETDREQAGRGPALAVWLSSVLALGLLMFCYHHLAVLADGGERTWRFPFLTEMTAALGAGLLFFGVRALVAARPLDVPGWPRRLPLYGAGFVAFALSYTSLNWLLRAALFPLAGLGAYDYGRMPLRYLMEAPMQAILFSIMVAALHGVRRLRGARERELQHAQVERTLALSRLRNLQLQLQPHFLFNALNTISSTMYEDLEAADKMIERLGDLLRASLRGDPAREVPLATELALLESYLAILCARFGERLAVRVLVDEGARAAVVPSLVLQPLVENAVRHGGVEQTGAGAIEVRATRRADSLILTVIDDGPGMAPGIDPLRAGFGLRTTAERLRLLYGDHQRIAAANAPGGGFRVDVHLPYIRWEGATA